MARYVFIVAIMKLKYRIRLGKSMDALVALSNLHQTCSSRQFLITTPRFPSLFLLPINNSYLLSIRIRMAQTSCKARIFSLLTVTYLKVLLANAFSYGFYCLCFSFVSSMCCKSVSKVPGTYLFSKL